MKTYQKSQQGCHHRKDRVQRIPYINKIININNYQPNTLGISERIYMNTLDFPIPPLKRTDNGPMF